MKDQLIALGAYIGHLELKKQKLTREGGDLDEIMKTNKLLFHSRGLFQDISKQIKKGKS